MANKKISQLTSLGSVGIGSADYFVVSESVGAGNYATVKTTPSQLANYVLNPISATQISGAEKNVFFNNSNWATAGLGESFPYLQVDINNGGKLVTGSGISVPAIADNMGDCVATEDIYMQGNDITGALRVGFGSVYGDGLDRSIISTDLASYGNTLEVKAYTDLTLSGNRHVSISGQAIDVASTPFSGNVTITGGNVEIDPANKLIVNQISGYGIGGDNALLTMEGASTHVPFSNGSTEVDWSNSNIQYKTHSHGTSLNYDFSQVADGQTLTLYYQNTHNSTAITPKFRSGVFGPDTAGAVRWGAEYSNGAPTIAANKTNLYTFVRMNTGIFASAVTGYVY